MIALGQLGYKPWEIPILTLSDFFLQWEGFREVHYHLPKENARLMCYFMANHKAKRPEDLYPLEIDILRLRKHLESGKANVVTVREQTKEEKEMLMRINGHG